LLSPPLPTGGILVAGLLLRRDIDQKRPFSSRDRLLFEMVHSEAGRINSSDPSFGGSDVLHLTPRQYQTLKGLLDGHGEKQIATRMRLSSNTIHSHIKALHRYYRVSSRSELLAHFVQRAHGISNALPTMK
jgi:DNA-binding CsgD family transcriptional regulator